MAFLSVGKSPLLSPRSAPPLPLPAPILVGDWRGRRGGGVLPHSQPQNGGTLPSGELPCLGIRVTRVRKQKQEAQLNPNFR